MTCDRYQNDIMTFTNIKITVIYNRNNNDTMIYDRNKNDTMIYDR